MLYIDTNIILDALLARKNRMGKDISNPAIKLFYRTVECEFYITLSSWTMEELDKHLPIQETGMFFEMSEIAKRTPSLLQSGVNVRRFLSMLKNHSPYCLINHALLQRVVLDMLKRKTIIVRYSKKDVLDAKILSPGHFEDALHAILAKKAGATHIVTRNINDFRGITNLHVCKPEQL